MTDLDSIRHEIEVRAESLYEAAVLALAAFELDDWTDHIGPATRLQVEARGPSVAHEIGVQQVQRWLDRGSGSPNEIVRRRQLKELLGTGHAASR